MKRGPRPRFLGEQYTVAHQRFTAKSSLWSLLRRVLGGMGLGLSLSTTPALAQGAVPQAIPAHWIAYAEQVSVQLQDRLADAGNAAVLRLHAWMQQRVPAADKQSTRTASSAPLVLKLWVAPTGRVVRLEFESLGQAEADADLRQLLTEQPLREAPPADLRQPMALELRLHLLADS